MTISPTVNNPLHELASRAQTSSLPAAPQAQADKSEERQAFDQFVGQTFFGQMLSSMRKSVGKSAYMHGGHAEEVFQAQLDQVLTEKMADASASTFTQPMYELFSLRRK